MTIAPREIIPAVQLAVVAEAAGAAAAVEAVATRARLIRITDPINHLFLALVIRLNRRLAIQATRPPGPIPIVTGRLVSRLWFNCGI